MSFKWLACLALLLAGCPSVTVDEDEVQQQPMVEFDPANKIIPFPNNLLIDPTTGRVNLPEQCNESAASAYLRSQLNKLDGFAAYETTINVTFTEPVDMTTLGDKLLLYKAADNGANLDPTTAVAIPVIPVAGKAVRYTDQTTITACTGLSLVDQVTFIPTVALDQKSTYVVALLDGVKTAAGADFQASFTWSLIRQEQPIVQFDDAGNVIVNNTPLDPNNPEDRAQLAGIDLLWKAHAGAMTFLGATGHPRDNVLLAWTFNTETVTEPLDQAVQGSPASKFLGLPLLGNQSLSALATSRTGVFAQCPSGSSTYEDTQCLLRILLGGGNYTVGNAVCAAAGCAAVGEVLTSLLVSRQYTTDVTNTLYTGTGATAIPGPWTDPYDPTVVHDVDPQNPTAADPQAKIVALVLLPAGAPPADGWPTVIFQHDITRSRSDVLGVMGGLTAGSGGTPKFAIVAIDAVNHGSRAVRISNDASIGCDNVSVGIPAARPDLGPDPTAATQCYAPAFSTDLAATRDAFRQTVLDLQQLVVSVKACTTTSCGALKVDQNNVFFLGHGLIGGNLGSIATATSDLQAATLNAAGAGWLDILENTEQTEAFQCPLVDALIEQGVLLGQPYDPDAMSGLCTTDEWKTQPGYQQFAGIARWILDLAEPANFAKMLAAKRFLLQEIVPDEVVPNQTTDNLGALAGQPRGDASCGTFTDFGAGGKVFLPSAAILADPNDSLFLEYVTKAPLSADCPPGNTFSHGSLLKPAASVTGMACDTSTGAGCDGAFATRRLQTDLIYYFIQNIE